MTVEALMVKTLYCHSFQTVQGQAQSKRFAGFSFGRLTDVAGGVVNNILVDG